MSIRPKRRRHNDNPYVLELDSKKQEYTVLFKDVKGIYQKVNISEKIYNLFDKFELEDLSILNEYDNHIEHLEISDINLNKRMMNKEMSLEKLVEINIQKELINSAILELPVIQQRRIRKYYFDDKTFEEIAIEENCTKRAVKFSVDIALKKISKKISKYF
ncbi:MAG: sigma-70 family RNA polymerase sigma factor [Bacilli bacterium]|nr:sigma-70 family RNA polymerase sigma factor [Bacilli bacterium]